MTRQIRKLSKQKYYTSATIPKYYTYRIKAKRENFWIGFEDAVVRTSRSLIIRTWDGERYKGKWVWCLGLKNWIIVEEFPQYQYFRRSDIAYWKYEI